MAQDVTFVLNIDGNAHEVSVALGKDFENIIKHMKNVTDGFSAFNNKMFAFKNAADFVRNFSQCLNSAIAPGVALNASLQDLSAITGVTGKGLKEIEGYARQTAKTFGVDASQAVESYKNVLSQLSPELAKSPAALKTMGDSIATLSKTMGNDTAAAAEVLTTAMNQFQVSAEDPIAASREMARMMNVMAAAAKEGSAELPQIKQALEQAGMSAKVAGVSFEETNAAIQVLDKAGKKGAEGGVALRNVMNIMSRGRFMDKGTLDALAQAGVDVETLGNKSLSLTDRMRPLKAVMGDTALISKMFGMENQAAALALLNGLDTVDQYTVAITGTNTAYEQSETVMEGYAEKQARIQRRFDDLKISVFNATGDLGIWTDTLAQAAVPIAQLAPLFTLAGSAVKWCNSNWGGFITKIKTTIVAVNMQIASMCFSIGGVSGMFNKMGNAGVKACAKISLAIYNIPIIGWIAAAVAAVVAFAVLLWQKCEGFRRLVMGVWESLKAIFYNVWVLIKTIFSGIWNAVKWCWDKIVEGASWLWEKTTGVFSAIGDFLVGLWTGVTSFVGNVFNWIVTKLGAAGVWIKEKLVEPIKGAFAKVWDFVKDIFDKILNKLGKLFQPIKELWNKLFPKDKFKDVSDAYAIGAAKGSESWRRSQEKKKKEQEESTTPDINILGEDGKPATAIATPTSGLDGGSLGRSAGESAGKAQQINISLKSMVDTMNFNGGIRENAAMVESTLREMMARILGMAETAV